jgi:hypothetical protein
MNDRFQYDPEVKGIFLNVRFSAALAVQRCLILLPTERPGSSGKLPFPLSLAMTR